MDVALLSCTFWVWHCSSRFRQNWKSKPFSRFHLFFILCTIFLQKCRLRKILLCHDPQLKKGYSNFKSEVLSFKWSGYCWILLDIYFLGTLFVVGVTFIALPVVRIRNDIHYAFAAIFKVGHKCFQTFFPLFDPCFEVFSSEKWLQLTFFAGSRHETAKFQKKLDNLSYTLPYELTRLMEYI